MLQYGKYMYYSVHEKSTVERCLKLEISSFFIMQEQASNNNNQTFFSNAENIFFFANLIWTVNEHALKEPAVETVQ